MKCQACDKPATLHVTDIVDGHPVERHVCDMHLETLEQCETTSKPDMRAKGFPAFITDTELGAILRDKETREKPAAYFLPPLCLALLDPKPEARVMAAFQLMMFGTDAQSAVGALQGALQDSDERVRKAARIALEHIQSKDAPT